MESRITGGVFFLFACFGFGFVFSRTSRSRMKCFEKRKLLYLVLETVPGGCGTCWELVSATTCFAPGIKQAIVTLERDGLYPETGK